MDIQQNFDLSGHNSFAVAAKARAYCEVRSRQDLDQALAYAAGQDLPLFVLGGGSNVLFTSDYAGLVAHIALTGIETNRLDGEQVELIAAAGENWHYLVMYCLKNNLYRIENLALIPGTVGAAPIQNIGAYGVELADVFVELEAVETASGRVLTMAGEACKFGYRDSIFKHSLKNRVVITSVSLRLSTRASPELGHGALATELDTTNPATVTPRQVANAVMAIRRRKLPDPDQLPNCGSFFKNPLVSRQQYEALTAEYEDVPGFSQPGSSEQIKVPAAWLLDKAGWKGRRQGAVGVHEHQAVVIVNHGGATGFEVLQLARAMQQSAAERFSVELEPEVRIV